VTCLVLLGTGLAAAQESREISDRWGLSLGYTTTDTKTDLFAGSVIGAVIRVEDVLDFDENDDSIHLGGFYRFGANKKGKHSIVAQYVDSQRDSSGVISAVIPILDEEFVGAFESKYDTKALSAAYRLSLVRTDRAEAGIVAGLSIIDYSFELSGEIDSDGDQLPDDFASESADFLAPLPTFGFFLKYAVTPNLIFDIGAASLDLEIGDIDGRVLDSTARLTWYFSKHFGVGLGIGGTDVNVTNNKDGDIFKVDYRQTTGTIAVSAVF